jgi:hypothetical protein
MINNARHKHKRQREITDYGTTQKEKISKGRPGLIKKGLSHSFKCVRRIFELSKGLSVSPFTFWLF